MKRPVKIVVAGVGLTLLAIPFLLCGGFLAAGELVEVVSEGEVGIYDQTVYIGPLVLTGKAAWAIPLVVGSGGTLGGVALLIWAWRFGRRDP